MSASQKLDTVVIFTNGASFSQAGNTHSTSLSIYELRKNLEAFTNSLKMLLSAVADAGGGSGLKTVEVAVGIDGSGNVGLLGTGGNVGAHATITMTFSR